MAPNLFRRPGVAIRDRRTFHSTPSNRAARDRFEDPTYAVSKPVLRRKSQAFAWSLVRSTSYWIFTSAPKSLTSRSSAGRSVAPRYVVVMTRNGASRSLRRRSSGSSRRRPNHFTNAQIRSTSSEVSISARSSGPSDGSPCALVSRAASDKGVLGRVSPYVVIPGRAGGCKASSCRGWLSGSESPCDARRSRRSLTRATRCP